MNESIGTSNQDNLSHRGIDSSSTDNQSSSIPWKPIIIALIVVLGIVVFKKIFGSTFSHIKDAVLSPEDQLTLEKVLAGEAPPGALLASDKSPTQFIVNGNQYTDAQIVTLSDGIAAKYALIGASIAASLKTEAATVFDSVIILMSNSGIAGEVSEKGLDLYFRVLDVWAKRFDSATIAVANAIADIAEATLDGIDNSSECVQTVFVKNVTETSNTTDVSAYTVTIENQSSGGFLGMNKKKRSQETRESVKTLTRQDVRNISYIPHCVNWQLDVTQFAAVLASQALAVQFEYGLLSTVLAMAPKPSNFIRPVNV